MRAREFISEQLGHLSPLSSGPMKNTFIIPALTGQDPYKTYRFGVAIARARAKKSQDQNFDSEFSSEGAFGQHAVISTFDEQDIDVIDQALEMTGTSGGKYSMGSVSSHEPSLVNKASPIKGFKGYPR
jgi:hypothetical protein